LQNKPTAAPALPARLLHAQKRGEHACIDKARIWSVGSLKRYEKRFEC
jgi:hypothetical protein